MVDRSTVYRLTVDRSTDFNRGQHMDRWTVDRLTGPQVHRSTDPQVYSPQVHGQQVDRSTGQLRSTGQRRLTEVNRLTKVNEG
jgi:Glu-tRNA(Gln) amidotransferase subunit E-like FAD-binding protein